MEIILGVAFIVLLVLSVLLHLSQQNEITWLREQLASKRDHVERLERKEVGLPELKLEMPRSDIPPAGVAAAIDDVIGAWESAVTQEQLRADVVQYRRDGVTWEEIVSRLQEELA